jgi:hypothetical protein
VRKRWRQQKKQDQGIRGIRGITVSFSMQPTQMSSASLSIEMMRQEVTAFVKKYGREISTTLRDGRDDDRAYVLLGTRNEKGKMTYEKLDMNCVLLMNRSRTGVAYCLDQMNYVSKHAHETDLVVVGMRFGEDIFTVITRIAQA